MCICISVSRRWIPQAMDAATVWETSQKQGAGAADGGNPLCLTNLVATENRLMQQITYLLCVASTAIYATIFQEVWTNIYIKC